MYSSVCGYSPVKCIDGVSVFAVCCIPFLVVGLLRLHVVFLFCTASVGLGKTLHTVLCRRFLRGGSDRGGIGAL